MATSIKPSIPDDWFIDPLTLGAPPEDDSALSWQASALCSQTDPEAFFPEKGGSTKAAKRICISCEVRDQCLAYALANDERFGVWGGLSEHQRRKLRSDSRAIDTADDDESRGSTVLG